jgi:hypothetical protein
MEGIQENDGFWFKETVMTGDPLGVEKVLGLRCDAKKDEVCGDIKLN